MSIHGCRPYHFFANIPDPSEIKVKKEWKPGQHSLSRSLPLLPPRSLPIPLPLPFPLLLLLPLPLYPHPPPLSAPLCVLLACTGSHAHIDNLFATTSTPGTWRISKIPDPACKLDDMKEPVFLKRWGSAAKKCGPPVAAAKKADPKT